MSISRTVTHSDVSNAPEDDPGHIADCNELDRILLTFLLSTYLFLATEVSPQEFINNYQNFLYKRCTEILGDEFLKINESNSGDPLKSLSIALELLNDE